MYVKGFYKPQEMAIWTPESAPLFEVPQPFPVSITLPNT